MNEAQRAAVVAEATAWLRTPYHHHARLKGVGVDCAQLLCASFVSVVGEVETGHYATDWHLHRGEEVFSRWVERYGRELGDDEPLQPADVILFRYGRTYSHAAIVSHFDPSPVLIHAYVGAGVIYTRMNEHPLVERECQRWSIA